MNIRVADILSQKISEIQARVPVKFTNLQSDVPFEQYLSKEVAANSSLLDGNYSLNSGRALYDSISTEDSTKSDKTSANLLRAKTSLSASTAFIPSNKDELMLLINNNISQASQKYGVDPNLVRAVMKQESGFNPRALSSCGAQGLMQLMPGTADGLGVKDPWDITQNIEGGVKYLRNQLDAFNGDAKLALAAYNAGPNSVTKYGGIPPYDETQNYVKRVMDYYRMYSM